MRANVFGALVVKPIKFPDDLEFSLFPSRRDDESKIGPSYTFEDHQSWDWVRAHYPLNPEAEPHIKAGEPISVFTGRIVGNFPEGTEFPEGSQFEMLEP